MSAVVRKIIEFGMVGCGVATVSCAATPVSNDSMTSALAPGTAFDLSHWNITVPTDTDNNKKPDTVKVADIQTYSHPDFFFLDEAGRMTFATPNKAFTTPNSSNTRSELRYMLRGTNTKIKTNGAGNNMVVQARRDSDKYASIGGKMEATLRVDHVARRAKYANKAPAFSVVIGQIHATKTDNNKGGFGYGNEPLKIYYKKFPDQNTGSVFWTYERNLAKADPLRKDIAYPVWGNTWENPADPGAAGVSLGEDFSYVVNVHKNTMHLTFDSPRLGTKTFALNLANNIDAYGNVDAADHPQSYGGDSLYFKAGAYDQCSTKDDPGFWYAACPGTGDWAIDKANGDYVQVSFSRLVVGPSTAQ